jgi:hypothetical protein
LQRDPNRIIAGRNQLELTARQGVRELEVAQRTDRNSTRGDIPRVKQCGHHSTGRCLHPRRPLGIGEVRHAPQKVVLHVFLHHDSTDDQALESDEGVAGTGPRQKRP